MSIRLVALAFDTQDPERVAPFWSHALGWTATPAGNGDIQLTPTDVTAFTVVVRPGGGDKTGQNRVHVDLTTASIEDRDTTVSDLLDLGGAHVDIGQSPEEDHIVLADPDGNELCVLAPGNNFLAGCPRLGAVNCDGTSALGRFWSAALGWPLVWDQDEETAIQAPDGTGPKITWSGPPLMPRTGPERIHFHLAPQPGVDADDAAAHLLALGAQRAEQRTNCPGTTAFIDVDGNPFCLTET